MTPVFQNPKKGDSVVIVCFCEKCLKKAEINFLTGLTITEVVTCIHGKPSEILIDNSRGVVVPFNPDGASLREEDAHFYAAPNTWKDRKRLYAIVARKIKDFHKKGKSA